MFTLPPSPHNLPEKGLSVSILQMKELRLTGALDCLSDSTAQIVSTTLYTEERPVQEKVSRQAWPRLWSLHGRHLKPAALPLLHQPHTRLGC